MAGARDHQALAERNEKVIGVLAGVAPFYHDWATTVAFYKAVHLVEALFDRDGVGHCSTHSRRLAVLKHTCRYQKIYRHFRPLKSMSELARYLEDHQGRTVPCFSRFLPEEQFEDRVLNGRLRPLERSVRKLLAQKGSKGRGKGRARRKYPPRS